MVKHVVLWKLDASYSEKEKEMILQEFRSRILALENYITELVHLAVYLRDKSTPESNYDIMLESVFNKVEDLETYQNHPEHQKVVRYVKSLHVQRAAIDFTF